MDWSDLAEAAVPWLGNLGVAPRPGGHPFVVQTRILFHRNFSGLPFLVSAAPADCAAMVDKSLRLLSKRGGLSIRRLADCPPETIRLLRERHILPFRAAALPGRNDFKYLAVAPGGGEWVMVNEVEHMIFGKIQAGLPDPATVASAWRPPEDFEVPCPWARIPALGFLASDPARAGAGMSAEILVHLPGLSLSRRIPQVRNYLAAVGTAFLSVEHTATEELALPDTGSGLYWLKSRGGPGTDGGEVYRAFLGAVEPVLRAEREAQARCVENHREKLGERVRRSLLLLQAPGSLGYSDMLAHGSLARFGAYAGLADPGIADILEELRIKAATGHLAVTSGREMGKEEEDFLRSNIVRSYLMTRSGEIT